MRSDKQRRKDMVEVAKRIHRRGWISASDGNLSVKLDDNAILTTPTGVHKGYMDIDDFVVVDMEGKKISGSANPSSELAMHLECYRNRDDINAVIHAHPTYCVAFSVANIKLAKCLLPEIVFTLGSIPTADYAPPTTNEVPKSIEKYIKDFDAIILERHGSVTVGGDIFSAYNKLERMEHVAEITYHARQLGKAEPLSDTQVTELVTIRENLGLPEKKVAMSCNECNACKRFGGCKSADSKEEKPSTVSDAVSTSKTEPAKSVIANISPEVIEMITKEVKAELASIS